MQSPAKSSIRSSKQLKPERLVTEKYSSRRSKKRCVFAQTNAETSRFSRRFGGVNLLCLSNRLQMEPVFFAGFSLQWWTEPCVLGEEDSFGPPILPVGQTANTLLSWFR